MTQPDKKDVLRDVDDEARLLAKCLLHEAKLAALATLEVDTGHPQASRVTMATMMDGTPVILVSDLSSHTPAMLADHRCSLLIGEGDKGDPLAHARMTIFCRANKIGRDSTAYHHARRRFLNRHPKAALYVDFGDFHFFELKIDRISLNGGFGKAYALKAEDVVINATIPFDDFNDREEAVIEHMNEDHADTISDIARVFGKSRDEGWQMFCIDPGGMVLTRSEQVLRIPFPRILQSPDDIRPMLVLLSKQAKKSTR